MLDPHYFSAAAIREQLAHALHCGAEQRDALIADRADREDLAYACGLMDGMRVLASNILGDASLLNTAPSDATTPHA